MKIPFLSLDLQNNLFREKILSPIERAYHSNNYVLDQNVTGFEKEYSSLNSVFPIAEGLAKTSLSLPIYPGLKENEITYICEKTNDFV